MALFNMASYIEKLRGAGASKTGITRPGGVGASAAGMAMDGAKQPTPSVYKSPSSASSATVAPPRTGATPGLGAAMGGVDAAARGFTGGNVHNGYAPQPGSQASHTAFINKTVAGGIDAYKAAQQVRYNQALAGKDNNLIDRLNKDQSKVGYKLNDRGSFSTATATEAEPTPPTTPAPDDYQWITDMVNNELEQQKSAIEQELARLKQESELAVNQNGTFLQDQIKRLEENRIKAGNEIINFQNRRGGYWSGGVDYQTATNNDSFAEAEGGVTKDIAARNTDIWNRNKLLAEQASANLSRLQQQAPDRIRQLIEEQKTKDAEAARADAGLTGDYLGKPTLAAKSLDFSQDMASKQFDRGVLESDRSYDFTKAQQEWQNMFAQKQFDEEKASKIWERAFQEKSFAQDVKEAAAARGVQWAGLNQRNREFVADQAFREKQFKLEERKYEESKNGGSQALQEELDGLYNGLSTNQLSPTAATSEINNRLRMGLITSQDASQMKSFIQQYVEGGSGGRPQVVDQKLLGMTSEQLLKAWETDPTGQKSGRGMYDWRSWVTDPRGYKAGLTFEMWRDQFGPQLGG